MRRLLTTLLAVVLVCSMSTPAFAAEEEKEIDVSVKYVSTVDGAYVSLVQNRAASINAGGVTVSVTGAPSNAKTLVVIPMTGDALSWIDSCADGDAEAAYDIHFEDAEGNRINASGVSVSIAVSGTELIVSSVTTSGADKKLSAAISGGVITFTADGSHYYAISQEKGSESADTPTNPPTRDTTVIGLWIFTMNFAVSMIIFLVFWKRRKKDEEEKAHDKISAL